MNGVFWGGIGGLEYVIGRIFNVFGRFLVGNGEFLDLGLVIGGFEGFIGGITDIIGRNSSVIGRILTRNGEFKA